MFKKTFVHRTPLVAASDFLCSDEILLSFEITMERLISSEKVKLTRKEILNISTPTKY